MYNISLTWIFECEKYFYRTSMSFGFGLYNERCVQHMFMSRNTNCCLTFSFGLCQLMSVYIYGFTFFFLLHYICYVK